MGEIAHVGAAVFLFDRDAVQAQSAHLGPQMDGEFVLGVDLGGQGGDTLGGEAGYRVAQGVYVGAKAEIEAGGIAQDHGAFPRQQSE